MQNLSLFDIDESNEAVHSIAEMNSTALSCIGGLGYRSDFVSPVEELELLQRIDSASWSTELERRVQHYGFKYNYKSRRIDLSMRIGEIPDWLRPLTERLSKEGLFERPPDQVIVNEYLPGQGITPHIDCEPCFDDTVVSLSLGSGVTMDFTRLSDQEQVSVWLEPRSIVTLKRDARYNWKHSIPKRKKDMVGKMELLRARRVSLTFRLVIL